MLGQSGARLDGRQADQGVVAADEGGQQPDDVSVVEHAALVQRLHGERGHPA
jgi:hypothetical protein